MDQLEFQSWEWIKNQYSINWNTNNCFDNTNFGVTCKTINDKQHITEIDLSKSKLNAGSTFLPPPITSFYFPHLKRLNITLLDTTINSGNDLLVKDTSISILSMINRPTNRNNPSNWNLDNLQYLYISHEPTIKNIPSTFTIPSLISLELSTSNKFAIANQTVILNDMLFPNLQTLSFGIGNPSISSSSSSFFTSCTKLQNLYLSNIPNINFKGSRNLVNLTLINPIQYIPIDLTLYKQLERVVVKGRKSESKNMAFIGFSDFLNTFYDTDASMINAPSNSLLKWNGRLKNISFARNNISKAVDYKLANADIDLSDNLINISLSTFTGYCTARKVNFSNNRNLTDIPNCFYCSWPYVSSWFTNTNVIKPPNFNCNLKIDNTKFIVGIGSTIVNITGENLGYGLSKSIITNATTTTIVYIPNTVIGYRLNPPLDRNEKNRTINVPFYDDGDQIITWRQLTVVRGTPIITNATTIQLDDGVFIEVTGEFSIEVGLKNHRIEYGDNVNGYYPCHIQSFNQTFITCKTASTYFQNGILHNLTITTTKYGSATLNLVNFNKIYPIVSHLDSPIIMTSNGSSLPTISINGTFSTKFYRQTKITIDNHNECIIKNATIDRMICTPTLPLNSTGIKNLTIVNNQWSTSIEIRVVHNSAMILSPPTLFYIIIIILIIC